MPASKPPTFGFLDTLPASATLTRTRTNGSQVRPLHHASRAFRSNGQQSRTGVDIRYSVKTAQPLDISGRNLDLGAFAGTRGRAMALTGLMLELTGPDASLYRFSAEALFLGSPVMRVSGERVVVSGPTGREPLVGLRVGLQEANSQNDQVAQAQAGAKQSEKPTTTTFRPRQHRARRLHPAAFGFSAADLKKNRQPEAK